jgi:hypothetical protein
MPPRKRCVEAIGGIIRSRYKNISAMHEAIVFAPGRSACSAVVE